MKYDDAFMIIGACFLRTCGSMRVDAIATERLRAVRTNAAKSAIPILDTKAKEIHRLHPMTCENQC
jgi:hypothetical protein